MCPTKKKKNPKQTEVKADEGFLKRRGVTNALKGHPPSVNPSTPLVPSGSLLTVFAQKKSHVLG